MKLLTGLFRTMRKKLSLTHDNDMGAFRDKIEVLVKEKDTLSDDDIVTRVEELVKMTDDLPDGDEKEKLKRYLEDMKAVKGQEADVAGEAAKAVADLFEKLDKDAMEGEIAAEPAPEAAPEPLADAEPVEEEAEVKEEEKVEEPALEEPADGGEEVEAEEEVKEEEEVPAEDADPDPAYTLEEIYQFIKKRMAEDAEVPAEEEIEEETEEKTLEDACGVKDHGMPGITLNGRPEQKGASGGLDDLYKTMKGERNGL